jgi:lysozyme
MTILGTDISHWEDDPNTPKLIDFDKMKAAGTWFVIFKATQATFTDSVFKSSWSLPKGKLLRGAFCYLDYTKSGVEQAEYFCNAIKNDPPELPPIVDFECRVSIPKNPSGDLWNWLVYVEKTTGHIPIIYSGPDYWKNYGSTNIGWKKYPLWIANYGVIKPSIPLPWTDWLFWQFTDRGNGNIYGAESAGIDLDYFNGSYEQLQAICNIVAPTPPLTLEQKVDVLYQQAQIHGWI